MGAALTLAGSSTYVMTPLFGLTTPRPLAGGTTPIQIFAGAGHDRIMDLLALADPYAECDEPLFVPVPPEERV